MNLPNLSALQILIRRQLPPPMEDNSHGSGTILN